ncbi:hypothetical protein WJX82_005322 [Trebouxia sp. C0006]
MGSSMISGWILPPLPLASPQQDYGVAHRFLYLSANSRTASGRSVSSDGYASGSSSSTSSYTTGSPRLDPGSHAGASMVGADTAGTDMAAAESTVMTLTLAQQPSWGQAHGSLQVSNSQQGSQRGKAGKTLSKYLCNAWPQSEGIELHRALCLRLSKKQAS